MFYLKSKWNDLSLNSKIKADANLNIDIYLANDNGKKALYIYGEGDFIHIESSKYIEVSLNKYEKGLVFSLTLLDAQMEKAFIRLCEHLVSFSKDKEGKSGFNSILKEYKIWRKLLSSSKGKGLSEEKIKGLLAEMIFLNEHLINVYEKNQVIESWQGPELSHQDFIFSDLWYEVKATSEVAETIKISSIEQLENEEKGILVQIRLKRTNSMDEKAISINSYIDNIIKEEDNVDYREKLLDKLIQIGYFPNVEYDKVCYRFVDLVLYEVSNDFPRIVRRELPLEIGKVTYEIFVNNIKKYELGYEKWKNMKNIEKT